MRTSYPRSANESRAVVRICSLTAAASAGVSAPDRGWTGSTATRFCAAAAEARKIERMKTRKLTSAAMFLAQRPRGKLIVAAAEGA